MMWVLLICGLVLYRLVKRFFFQADTHALRDIDSSHFNALITVAKRSELKGNKYVLGEFFEFKGKQEGHQALRRSEVGRVTVQKMSMFDFGSSCSSSQWEEVTVRKSTEVVFETTKL